MRVTIHSNKSYLRWVCALLPLLTSTMPFSMIHKVSLLLFISIFLLATSIIPAWYTSIIFITSCVIGGVAEQQIVLSGVISSAAWLVVSGIIIGSSIKYTNLDKVLARLFIPICKGSYSRVLFGTILLGVALIFLMPSAMGRVVLLLPILNALSCELGYEKGSKEWEGILMSGILATYLPAFYVLSSNVPNNVFAGALSALYSINISYSQYFLLFFPTFGIGKIIILYVTMRVCYRKCKASCAVSEHNIHITKEQRWLILLLLVTLILWMTEHMHKIPAGWVGMATALIVMLPHSNLMVKQPLRTINFEPFFYVAGIISLGNVAKASGVADVIAESMIRIASIQSATVLQVSIFLIVLCIILGFVVTLPGVPAVVTPLIDTIASASNIPKHFLCNIEVVGFSNVFFPFQAPPLMVVLENEQLSSMKMMKYCSIVSIAGLALIAPSVMYWQLL